MMINENKLNDVGSDISFHNPKLYKKKKGALIK